MNFIRGELTGSGFTTSDGIVLPCQAQSQTATTYGVRPEHIKVDPNGVPFVVSVIEPMGSETQVIGRIGSQDVTALFRERIALSPGETIRVMPVASNVHLFDRQGQKAA